MLELDGGGGRAPEPASEHYPGSLLFLGAGLRDGGRWGTVAGLGFLGDTGSELTLGGPDREESGQGGLLPEGSVTFLWVPQLGKAYGVESHVLSPAETKALYPLMNVDDLYGTLYVPHDGTMDPAGTCTTLTRAATARGAQVQWPSGPGSPAPSPPFLPKNPETRRQENTCRSLCST